MSKTDAVTIERTFQNDARRYVVTVRIEPTDGGSLNVDLRPATDGRKLSITAATYERHGTRWVDVGGGQCQDSLRADFPVNPTVQRLCDIWDRHHLNNLQAGSREQQAIIDAWLERTGEPYEYGKVVDMLTSEGRLDVPMPGTDKVYRYGTQWLFAPLPARVEAELVSMM